MGHKKSSMAATDANGSISTTLLAYSFKVVEVPGARVSRSLNGCVKALRPAEEVSDELPSVRSKGKRSIMFSAS